MKQLIDDVDDVLFASSAASCFDAYKPSASIVSFSPTWNNFHVGQYQRAWVWGIIECQGLSTEIVSIVRH